MNFLKFLLTLSMFTVAAEAQCTECMDFLSKHVDADDSKAAEKECKGISSDKDVQKACKKVVKDVLKKGLDGLDTCKLYEWCAVSPPSEAPAINTPPPTTAQGSSPTSAPIDNVPTLVPTDPLPGDEGCDECMGFLANYLDEDDSKAAEKQCKVISSDKDVQKACKKVVKDVLKKGKDKMDTCKAYGWCPVTTPSKAPSINTSAPTTAQGSSPTSAPIDNVPTLVPTDPLPGDENCDECTDFLLSYTDADDSKAAEKDCKVVSSDKDVQKACKKVVKDVLKKGLDALDTCKAYGWCSIP